MPRPAKGGQVPPRREVPVQERRTARFLCGLQAAPRGNWLSSPGERTFSTIASRAGIAQAPLARALELLVDRKRVAAVERPLSLRPSNGTRYRVAAPYLRFWLRFVEPGLEETERARGRLVAKRVRRNWTEYRGRAIEALVREALELLFPD